MLFSWSTVPLKEVWLQNIDFSFFHESVSPRPLSIPLGLFKIFQKFSEIFYEWMFINGVNDALGIKMKSLEIKIFSYLKALTDHFEGGGARVYSFDPYW